jgi:4-nitrophenyl phosphatase
MTTGTGTLQHLILDMDGVLWRGETALPGVVDFFATLRRKGIGVVLATNNATKVAAQYKEKLAGLGVDIAADRILTSAEATAGYLSEQYPAGTTAYVVGESGLEVALRNREFNLLQSDGYVGEGEHADVVVVGFTRHVCYPQLASAAHLVNNGARFVGTNPDVTFPSEWGPLPGAGSLLAFLQAATGQEPLIVGKPNRAIFHEALARLGGTPQNTVMVGDRLETDIAGAQAAGLDTILLLSGVTGRQELDESDLKPDHVFDDLRALAQYLEKQTPDSVTQQGSND